MENNFKKKKINLLELLVLVSLIGFIGYITISTNITNSNYKEEIKKMKKVIVQNDSKIEEKEIYKRLQDYGYRLSTIDNLIKYKDSNVNWYEFLLEFRNMVPVDVTIKTLDYSTETKKIAIQLISPNEDRLLETLKVIEESEGFTGLEFNNINQEKVSFIGDKNQYKGFSTTISVYIDEKYLEDRYTTIRQYKKLKYDIADSENVMDLTNDFSNIGTGVVDTEILMSSGSNNTDTNTNSGELNQ